MLPDNTVFYLLFLFLIVYLYDSTRILILSMYRILLFLMGCCKLLMG